MDISCRTFNLGHILINYVGAAIAIAHDDRNGGNEDGRDGGMRRAAKSGGYCILHRKNNTFHQNLCAKGSPAPTEASGASLVKVN